MNRQRSPLRAGRARAASWGVALAGCRDGERDATGAGARSLALSRGPAERAAPSGAIDGSSTGLYLEQAPSLVAEVGHVPLSERADALGRQRLDPVAGSRFGARAEPVGSVEASLAAE